DVVWISPEKDVVGQHARYAAHWSLEGQLGPEEHVAEDPIIWLRPDLPQCPGARHASAPRDFAGTFVVGRQKLEAGFDLGPDHSGDFDILVVYGAASVDERKLRVPGEQGNDLRSEFRLEKVVIREAEKELTTGLLLQKSTVLGGRH